MYLIQVFLPLHDNRGRAFSQSRFRRVEKALTARFGGLTSYARSPAKGLWKPGRGPAQKDQIVIYEVMSARLDRRWWRRQRRELEEEFRQQELLIRAHAVTQL